MATSLAVSAVGTRGGEFIPRDLEDAIDTEAITTAAVGEIVEYGDTASVLKNPQHPYTKALIACIPKLGSKEKRLKTIDYGWLDKAKV